jgi:hypothetical protein
MKDSTQSIPVFPDGEVNDDGWCTVCLKEVDLYAVSVMSASDFSLTPPPQLMYLQTMNGRS